MNQKIMMTEKIVPEARPKPLARTGSALARSEASRVDLARIVDQSGIEAEPLLEVVPRVLAEALVAERLVLVQKKHTAGCGKDKVTTVTSEIVSLGPDHFARLTAVKRLTELLLAGRPVPKDVAAGASPGGVTLEVLKPWAEKYWQNNPETLPDVIEPPPASKNEP